MQRAILLLCLRRQIKIHQRKWKAYHSFLYMQSLLTVNEKHQPLQQTKVRQTYTRHWCVHKITFWVLLTLLKIASVSQFYHYEAVNSFSNRQQQIVHNNINKQEQLVFTSNCLIKLLTHTHTTQYHKHIFKNSVWKWRGNFGRSNRSLTFSMCRSII